jgi:oligosaccharyl transferase (archaeosortase A-associated)
MKISKLSPKLIVAILIAIIFFISLLFRIILPYHQVFTNVGIKFTSTDAYYYQRFIDNTAVNFPHMMKFDPYFIYPGGRALFDIFFPEWLIAGFAWLFGMGAPTQHTIDVVSVFFPAIFAALTVIPVYFIGKALFNRWVGVIAAGLTAVLPGEYLGRTILGLTDTPYAEVFLTTTFICFAILAVKAARERELTFDDIRRRNRPKCLRPVIYSFLAGVFLGIYLLSWQGALLFVFIFALYLVIQFIIDHLRQRSVDYLGIVGIITYLVALLIFFRFSPGSLYVVSLVLAFLIPVALVVVSRVMKYWKAKPLYYPVALVVIGGIAVVVFYLINPSLLKSMLSSFGIFAPSGATAQTTIEMEHFLDPTNTGTFNTSVAWGNFGPGFFLGPWWLILVIGLAAMAALYYRYYMKGSTTSSLFLFLVPVLIVIAVFAVKSDTYEIIQQVRYPIIREVVIFPGLALIALAILVYLFIRKKGSGENYLRSTVRVVVILVLIMAELLFYGYGHRVLSLIPLVVLFGLLFLPGDDQKNWWLLFIVWTLVILALTMSQRRYAYYLIINIALLTAYISWQIIWLAGVNKLGTVPKKVAVPVPIGKAKVKKKEVRREKAGATTYIFSTTLAGLMVFFLVFFPNIMRAKDIITLKEATYAPTDAWVSSLLWLKDNSPEPFGDPAVYYHHYDVPPTGENFTYPSTAYGVTSWWDYGYWITQIAHRIPSANPSQDPEPIIKVANLFLSENDTTAKDLLAEMNTSYVILDNTLTQDKFWAMVTWAGQQLDKYFDVYFYAVSQNQLQPVQLYYPEYYRTLAVRLYNFNGKATTTVKPLVITYTNQVDSKGTAYKLITDSQQFDSYQAALDYLNSQTSGNHAIVSVNPFVSPVALDAVPGFQLVHSSEQGTSVSSVGFVPEVKIFQYTGQ